MSLSTVRAAVSGLKSCQTDMGTAMDVLTDVALSLAETQQADDDSGIRNLEAMVLECAKLDREISHFVDIIEQVTTEVGQEPPEAMFSLSTRVKEQFTDKISRLADVELQNHQKVVSFKENIRNYINQVHPEIMQELDEDIAVTQSQVNLTCPLTQEEMVNPMRNRKCNHHYDESAILDLIHRRNRQKKNCRCPVVGCENAAIEESDLIPDQMLKRMIQNKQNRK